MDFLINHLQDAADIPASTMTLILVMCAIAMYFIRSHLVIPGLVVVLYPLVVALAVGANYGLTKSEYFAINKYDQWIICTITSATLGVVGGLVAAVGLARVTEFFQTRQKFNRA